MEKTILVTGGKYQDKLAIVFKKYALSQSDLASSPMGEGKIWFNLEQYVRDNEGCEEDILKRAEGKIIICDEIGCGIVPLEPKDRMHRERYGRLVCRLALFADTVIRVQCGIVQTIKGE